MAHGDIRKVRTNRLVDTFKNCLMHQPLAIVYSNVAMAHRNPWLPRQRGPILEISFFLIKRYPVPINGMLRGQLPSFDGDTEDIDLPDMTISDDMKQRNSFPLIGQILNSNLFMHCIPKQVELDKFLQICKKKVIHDFSLPISIKELRAEYPNSPFFSKDTYRYIVKGSCSFTGKAKRVFKAECLREFCLESN